uniref:uncharacterized protein LOC105351262 n=1 Tax=Fragaria vesca subsp. vesca TaxID=101020 RepID=UPI0005C80307|nr:PREDICTED: uncharacterized protein LOC105351262 [Fragaria vesca subsp. vesca]
MAVGAIANRDSGEDKAIIVRVFGSDKIYWYVIEEKSAIDDDENTMMIGCESDTDRVRRLDFLCSDFDEEALSINLAVKNSTLYLIGGRVTGGSNGEHIAYRHLDLDSGEEGEWRPAGGNLVNYQYGGASVGPDGYIYTVGDFEIYRFSTCGKFHEELIPPAGRERSRLLGLSRKKLFIYTIGGGANGGNLIYCFDLKSRWWDVLDLGDNFRGDWSAGVVLFEDSYLFSFGSQNPTREEDAEVPGIYVFDIENCQWLSEPVEGLPTDGKVLPVIYEPEPHLDPDEFVDIAFSPFLLQIGKQEHNKLALLWDGHGTHPESHGAQLNLVWSKFVLNCRTSTTAQQDPHFYANSVSSGYCPLDDCTSDIVNCAAEM